MYVVYNKNYIQYYLMNESKILIFAYNSDRGCTNLIRSWNIKRIGLI